MSILEGILNSDVNFPIDQNELEEAIFTVGSLDAAVRKPAAARVARLSVRRSGATPAPAGTSTTHLTAKAEFEQRIHLLRPEIQAALRRGQMQVVDREYYTARRIDTATTAELMLNSDVAVPGLANLNNRKLEVNHDFLLTGIMLQTAVSADVLAANFGVPVRNILNGEFELEVGSTVIIPRSSCEMFNTTGRADGRIGYYRLENPKFIAPQSEIKPKIFSAGANVANTCVKIVLIGASVWKK